MLCIGSLDENKAIKGPNSTALPLGNNQHSKHKLKLNLF